MPLIADKRLNMARAIALLVPAALLAGAYVSQYGFGLYPCEMCWWQRYAHFAALVPAVLAFVVPGDARRLMVRIAGAVILIAALLGGWAGFADLKSAFHHVLLDSHLVITINVNQVEPPMENRWNTPAYTQTRTVKRTLRTWMLHSMMDKSAQVARN